MLVTQSNLVYENKLSRSILLLGKTFKYRKGSFQKELVRPFHFWELKTFT